ncbi:3'-5' exonuclease [Roseovarius sp. E0-M6]|uniref:3'-5' exonuclease n=1 Tax=Roseovarius sp. E0-M6 TaxID=3127118 RepID=UPI00300FA19E
MGNPARGAGRLAQDTGAQVLLTTFNEALAEGLARKLPLLAGEDVRARITVRALGSLISDLHAERFGETGIASEDEIRSLLRDGAATSDVSFTDDFLHDEWSLVVDAWDIRDLDTYRDLPRLGRKVRMPAARRDAAWMIFDGVRAQLGARGMKTNAQLAHDLSETGAFPFTHAVIDEAQDISVPELRLLGKSLGDTPNGLFFAGDIGQRIFRAPFPWAAAGVEIRGRSRSLKVNYRTSHQIRRYSDDLLPETLVEPDGTEENRLGITSVFDGETPEIHSFDTREDELEAVNAWLGKLEQTGVPNNEVVCLVRMSKLSVEIGPRLPVRVMPMHEAKGAEYRAVAVLALDQDIVPLEDRLMSANDEARLDEIMNTERHLLYVAASRARDHLWISGVIPVSEFLTDILQ